VVATATDATVEVEAEAAAVEAEAAAVAAAVVLVEEDRTPKAALESERADLNLDNLPRPLNKGI
jgi:hypothetical protein